MTEQQAVGVLTATDGPMAGSLATGSLRPCKKLRSGGAVARPCDMSDVGDMAPPRRGAIGVCAALFGGVGRRRRVRNKQLDNQLDCWWKAKGGINKGPVTVTNHDESQPPLAR